MAFMAMKFNITKTELAGVLVIEPAVYGDSRGVFLETFNQKRRVAATESSRWMVLCRVGLCPTRFSSLPSFSPLTTYSFNSSLH